MLTDEVTRFRGWRRRGNNDKEKADRGRESVAALSLERKATEKGRRTGGYDRGVGGGGCSFKPIAMIRSRRVANVAQRLKQCEQKEHQFYVFIVRHCLSSTMPRATRGETARRGGVRGKGRVARTSGSKTNPYGGGCAALGILWKESWTRDVRCRRE